MTILKQIMDLLSEKEMSSVELAPILNISIANCSYKLFSLKENGKIIRTTKTKPYKYKTVRPIKDLLKFLNNFFKDNLDYLSKNSKIERFIEENEDIFNQIEEMVKNA